MACESKLTTIIIVCLAVTTSVVYDWEFVGPSKNFGTQFIPDGINMPLEEQAKYWAEPYEEDGFSEIRGSVLARLSRNLQLRQENELERLWRILDGEAVYFGDSSDFPEHQIDSTFQIERRAAPAETFGYRSLMKWQPVVIASFCAAFAVAALVGAALYEIRRRRIKRRNKEMEDEFDAVISGKHKRSPADSGLSDSTVDGDRKLAHSAQMYHYQHQKQQMLAIEKASDQAHSSDEASNSDHEEGHFTVYECPGLAQPGQLEVENPLYVGECSDHGPEEALTPSDADEGSDSTPTAKSSADPPQD